MAFAMVWVDDGADALNRNEAYALASCRGCTTVAVAFQVVFVVGQSDVVIPQNTAAAVNYNCLSCVTVALAQQLLVTVERLPSAKTVALIQDLWADLMTFSEDIEGQPFTTIVSTLQEFQDKVKQALVDDGALELPPSTTTRSSGPSPSTDASPSAEPSAGIDAGEQPSDDASADPGTGETTGDTTDGSTEGSTDGTSGGGSSPTPDTEPTDAADPTEAPSPEAVATP